MLNIGKLGRGSEDYYLSQVAPTPADYYTGRGEAPGRWIGRGAEQLGLDGIVDPDVLRAVLEGHDPGSDEPLLAQTQRKVPGFDLAFRPPKSVSLLWALSDPDTSVQVRNAHDAAVAAALGYLERNAAFTRRGRGGAERVPIEGFVAAAFRHRTSRADDPLLHTHVLVANLAYTPDDGAWRSLDARHLYIHAKTAGYLYQAHLRAELTRRLDVEWGRVRNGYADLEGVPRDVIETFSRRRADVRAALRERGHRSARAAQVATLTTRPAKSHADPDTLREVWRRRARQLGFGPRQVAALTYRRSVPELEYIQLQQEAQHLLGPAGLTSRASTFDRRDVLRGWAEQLRAGAPIIEVERLADDLLDERTGATVRLTGSGAQVRSITGGASIRLADGRLVVAADDARYSTPELLALEQHLIRSALARRDAGLATAPSELVEQVLAAAESLSDEQADAVRRLTTSGAGVEVVVGRAGSGKTFTLGTARHIWQAAGLPVIGCALAARAALELQRGSGIPSATIDRLLIDLQRPGGALAPGSVLVVDEAAMVGTRTLARLLDAATAADAKVVLVGDHHQLPEIDAGGTFRGLVNRLDAIELTDNRRQIHEWERRALDQLREGDVRTAVAAYDDHDRIVVGDTAEAVREQLVGEWWDSVAEHGHDAVMVAARRADIDDLNARARERMALAGELSGRAVEASDREFRVGDRVLCLRNHRSVGVVNGTRGTVTRVDRRKRSLTFVRDDTGERVVLPAVYLDAGWVDHAYALTAHKAQGLTCQATFVLGSDEIYREWGYVALSRGRHTNRLYLVDGDIDWDPPDDPTHPEAHQHDGRPADQRLVADLRRSHQQVLAADHLPEPAASPGEPDAPAYVLRALGPRPGEPSAARVWRGAVGAIETYRRSHRIDHPTRALGHVPDEPSDREAYQQAMRRLLDARRRLAPDTRARQPDLQRGIA